MNKNILYSVTALFKTPNEIIHAADEVKNAGYTKFDVHTPYPVHGMDGAMGLKDSKIGRITLVVGIFGALFMIGFMSWVAVIDYPQVFGGKPFWSWPAFVPITYEFTVLSAVLTTVAVMLIVFFKFPNNSHPLHDTSYMKKVSSDTFGISIQAEDPMFDEKKVKEFLKKIGGEEIVSIYYDEEEISYKPRVFEPRFLLLLVGISLAVSGGTYFHLNKVLYMVPFNWMMEQFKITPQSKSTFYTDGFGMRPPVEGTVARGFIPYPYKGKPDDAGKYLINPLVPTKAVLEKGKNKYLTYCSPCHGNLAEGDSRLRGQFPNPPTLHSDKVRNWSDGNMYHVITEGQNVMPSYAAQIDRDERWAIVHYVRTLQRAFHAKEEDVK